MLLTIIFMEKELLVSNRCQPSRRHTKNILWTYLSSGGYRAQKERLLQIFDTLICIYAKLFRYTVLSSTTKVWKQNGLWQTVDQEHNNGSRDQYGGMNDQSAWSTDHTPGRCWVSINLTTMYCAWLVSP